MSAISDSLDDDIESHTCGLTNCFRFPCFLTFCLELFTLFFAEEKILPKSKLGPEREDMMWMKKVKELQSMGMTLYTRLR
jgi:hypothetical protein